MRGVGVRRQLDSSLASGKENESNGRVFQMPLVIPSFPQAYPKLLMNGDTTGQGIEGPAGAFSLEEAGTIRETIRKLAHSKYFEFLKRI